MDVDVLVKKLKALNLGLLLAPAEKNVKEGRTKDARIFLKELKKSTNIRLKLPQRHNPTFGE